MATTMRPPAADEELRSLLRTVRARWRMRVALLGVAAALGVALLAALAAAWVVARGGDEAVTGARLGLALLVLAAAAWFVARPLRRRPPDRQVALYLEENEPTLDAAVVSAVEWQERAAAGSFGARLAETAVARARAVEFGRRVERQPLRRAVLALAVVATASVVVLSLAPSTVRDGLRRLFLPAAEAMPAGVRRVALTPGDVEVARGGDQLITATLTGFTADSAELFVRALPDSGAPPADSGEWMRVPMTAGRSGGHDVRLYDIVANTEYYVEADGVRSPTHRLSVVDLPAVARIDLVYDFPAYTGLAPDSVSDGGDIAAPVGTSVRVRAVTTMPTAGGRLVVEGGDTVSLAATADGALEGTIVVRRPGFYRVELAAVGGRTVRGSLDYVIDVVEDRPPTVSISKPGRDLQPTSLEEVFAEARADDDYGIARLELVYAVNGAAEQVVSLHQGRQLREVTAGHTLFLEELGLQPGDVVSYYARATDGNRATGPQTATTDIYFLQIRRFGRDYRSADQQGGGGGGGQQSSPGSLSRRQRDLVAATFKARGELATDAARARQDISTIMIGQGRLREETEELSRQMVMRGVAAQDTNFAKVAEALPLAVAAMREAEEALARRDAAAALGPEQRALQQLQRAEAAFRETEIARGGGGGGGGGGGESSAEELADLFELEADKLQNQYETVERAGSPEQRQQAVDEVAERLRELARRQQQADQRMAEAAARMRQQAGGGGGGASDGGAAQRQLAAEADSIARQLERLVREQPSQAMREAAQGLQQAADEMRRAAASAGRDGTPGAAGAAARDRLAEAQRRLEQARQAGLDDAVEDARRRAEQLAARQRELSGAAARAQEQGGAERQRSLERLSADKESLARDAESLEEQLAAAAREARAEQPDASRRLQEAATEIRDRRLPDKLRFSGQIAGRGSPEYSRSVEGQLAEDVEAVRQAVDAAAGAIREPAGRRDSDALDRARSLARATESLRERTRAAAGQGGERGEREGQGQQAQQGQQGQQGQRQQGEGQQSQGGQQGQRGQQGEGGQRGEPGGERGAPGGAIGGEAGGGDSRGGLRAGGGGPGRVGTGGSGEIPDDRARQLAREAGERRREAEALRSAVAARGLGTRDLDRLLTDLRALERERVYDDAEEVERLQANVVEGFKAFEFALRRALGGVPDRPLVGRAAEAPAEYRALVEEYYRSLARTPPR